MEHALRSVKYHWMLTYNTSSSHNTFFFISFFFFFFFSHGENPFERVVVTTIWWLIRVRRTSQVCHNWSQVDYSYFSLPSNHTGFIRLRFAITEAQLFTPSRKQSSYQLHVTFIVIYLLHLICILFTFTTISPSYDIPHSPVKCLHLQNYLFCIGCPCFFSLLTFSHTLPILLSRTHSF